MKRILAFLLCRCLAFSGCGIADREEILDLLSSPRLSPEESRVISALSDYLGTDIMLKYPRHGENLRPIQMTSPDDSRDERIVFYSAPSQGPNVRLAVLKRREDGWRIIYDSEGLGSEIYKADLVRLSDEKGIRVAAAYTFRDRSEKLLAVYYCEEDSVSVARIMACQNFLTRDLTGDGVRDLVTAGINADNQRARIKIFSAEGSGGELVEIGSYDISVPNAFVTNLSLSDTDFTRRPAVAVDYRDPYYRVYTLAVYFDGGEMEVVLPQDTVQKIWPHPYDLISMDVDGDGYLETPTVIESDLSSDENLRFMEWTCFIRREPERKYYGAGDAAAGVFVPLPDDWQDVVTLSYDSRTGARTVSRASNGEFFLSFRAVPPGEPPSEDRNTVRTAKGTLDMEFVFAPSVTEDQREYITGGFISLKQEA